MRAMLSKASIGHAGDAVAALMVVGILHSPLALAVDTSAQCQATKLRAAAKQTLGALECHASAARAGAVVDAGCLSTEEARLSSTFTRAEAHGACATTGDAASVAALVTSEVAEVAALLRPSPSPSTCASSKLTALGRRSLSFFMVHAKQRKRANDSKLVAVSGDFADNLGSDFRRIEAPGGCMTVGDARARSKQIAALVGDATEHLWPATMIGLTLAHPPDWHTDPGLLALSGGASLELNNFSVLSGRQVSAVPGGATITVTRSPLPSEPLQQLIARRLNDTTNASVTPTSVGGTSGLRAVDTDEYDAGITERAIQVYVPRGGFLFEFSVTYLANDTTAGYFDATFNALLASVVFTP
jgi:hypothetical protein